MDEEECLAKQTPKVSGLCNLSLCTGKLWFISVYGLFPYGLSVWCFSRVFLYGVAVRCIILYGGWLSMFLVHGIVRHIHTSGINHTA